MGRIIPPIPPPVTTPPPENEDHVSPEALAIFAEAFELPSSSCLEMCHCGKRYYDRSHDGGWTWEPGELEALEASPAVGLPYGVKRIEISGTEYVVDCDCWHSVASQAVWFLHDNRNAVAKFLSLEKSAALDTAAQMGVVEP